MAAAQIELTRLIAEQAMIAGLLRLGGFEPGFPFALGADASRRQLGGERLAAFPRKSFRPNAQRELINSPSRTGERPGRSHGLQAYSV